MSIVIVDADMCQTLASVPASMDIPDAAGEIRIDVLSRAQLTNFHLLSVAICKSAKAAHRFVEHWFPTHWY